MTVPSKETTGNDGDICWRIKSEIVDGELRVTVLDLNGNQLSLEEMAKLANANSALLTDLAVAVFGTEFLDEI